MSSYERYRDVQSFWVSQVPEHWTTQKNKYVFTQKKEIVGDQWETFTLLTMGKTGVKPRDMDGGGKFPESFENYQVVYPDQLIFCLFDLDETPRTVGKSDEHGMITSAYDVFHTRSNHDSQYWTYFYQTIDDHKGLKPYYTGLRKVVRYDTFMGIEVYSPPLEEQQLISRYLDKKTKQIDSLIKKIQKKIELLKEQRTSLINQCVTKGLDPNVEMKDSGVEWFGEIPSHWKLTKLGYLGSCSNGVSRGSEYFGVGHPFITYGDVYNNDVIPPPSGLCLSDEKDWDTYSVCRGDIFFTRTSETTDDIGISSVCLETIERCCFSGFIIRFRPRGDELNPNFSRFYFRSTFPLIHFTKEMNQVTRSSLSQGLLKTCLVPIPPEREQEEISSYLTRSLEKIDLITDREIERVRLLQEYRQSLISSVVTGKVRVTEDMI